MAFHHMMKADATAGFVLATIQEAHGGQMAAMKQGSELRYVYQDHLTSTSLMTDTSGNQIDTTMKYLPFGETRYGSVPTDKLFTSQHIDGTRLFLL